MRSSRIAMLMAMLQGLSYRNHMPIPALGDSIPHRRLSKYRSKPEKKISNKPFKSTFSCGFRGWPRSHQQRGLTVAPTMEQVKALEKAWGQRLMVKGGAVYVKKTWALISRPGDYNNVLKTLITREQTLIASI